MICIWRRRRFYVRRLEPRGSRRESRIIQSIKTASTGHGEALYRLFLFFGAVGLDSFGIFTNAFGDAMFKSNGLLCKKPEKSPNCLGSVNRAVVRVVCHPAALGWHRRATDDTLQRTKVCFDQLSGGRACRPIVLVISWGEGYWLLLLETGTFMRREWGRPDVWTLAHVYSGTVLLRQ